MNGETQAALDQIEKKRDQQHLENLGKYEEIFQWMRERPCETNKTKLAWIVKGLAGIWAIVLLAIGAILTTWMRSL